MPILQLTEHQDSEPIELTPADRDQIADVLPRAVLQPAPGSDNAYVINPKNYVGVIRTGDYVIEAWHEELGTQTQNITVGEQETVEISFTFSIS